ncbi:hypothetical protein AV654_19795 [Paenibacillus elgii]|uniref:Copper amine oxidase-like N-terminal domain-containing protein n=1 Tax=Paenibacillus elgii TaxID=189691 RepID=A0A163XPC6_9BACL|nr:copper amine oxidase N-terminal domain-containing protein [Paenibacillus elgii]KZE78220.1 hypothetical protein AV654_19795 [Paenibacillus elgii]
MKKYLLGAVALLTMGLSATAYAADRPIGVYYMSETSPITFEQDPIIEEGTTLVQFRPLFERMGLSISWDPVAKRITGSNERLTIQLQIDSKNAMINGRSKPMEAAPKLVNGYTMVPLRFISEATGKRVYWKEDEQTLRIERGIEMIAESKQYGDESYYPGNYSGQAAISKPSIWEDNGILYVLWTQDQTEGVRQETKLYASIFKDGKWITKANLVQTFTKDTFMQNAKLLFGNCFYWRDSIGIRKLTVSATGNIQDDSYIIRNARANARGVRYDPEVIKPVYSENTKGILFGDKNGMRMYLESDSYATPKEFKDLNRVLLGTGIDDPKYVYVRSKGLLNIHSNGTIKQLNTNTGDMVYDGNGKDKELKVTPTTFFGSCYANGKMRYVYIDTDQRIKTVTVTDDLQIGETELSNYWVKENRSFQLIESSSEYHLWSNGEFNRRPAVQVIKLTK